MHTGETQDQSDTMSESDDGLHIDESSAIEGEHVGFELFENVV